MEEYTVYIRVDDVGRVVNINSNAFLSNVEGWVEISRGFGDKYQHAQGNYLPGPLLDKRGICRYKLQDGALVERTEEEMDSDVKPVEKSALENRLEKVETALNTITELLAKIGMK